MSERCRRDFVYADRHHEHCGKPAEFIVWGKFFGPETLGPRCKDCLLDQHPQLRLSNIGEYAIYVLPTKETYTREQLLSDEVIEALARESESRSHWAYSPGDPARARVRSSIRREIEAACNALDKQKGNEDG